MEVDGPIKPHLEAGRTKRARVVAVDASIDVAWRKARSANRQRGISPVPSASWVPKKVAEGWPRHRRLILEQESDEFILGEIPSPMQSNDSTKVGVPYRRCPSENKLDYATSPGNRLSNLGRLG
ncbi:unnamed protein product [Linum trigynum]|uniref:Uncharacterized protein n=1 Tax=Linum trigynum TaxID=586398 RepID=A0AAV2FW66_9ROSI